MTPAGKPLVPGGSGGPPANHHPHRQHIFECLSRAGRFRDEETGDHVERMSRTCSLIAAQLGWDPEACEELRTASILHDIGKIGIPDAVLRKPGPLTASERALMQCHPQIGYEILGGYVDPVMSLAATIALTHHERIDGTGYPNGLRGEEITLAGRIAAAADVFDALIRDRVYRPAMPVDRALAILRSGRGTQFDPLVLDAFEATLPAVLELHQLFPDSHAPRPAASTNGRPRAAHT